MAEQQNQEFITFKEFFELLKSVWDKNQCFPISVRMTSLLDLGLLTIDDRLKTLQSKFEVHEFLLQFFVETEMSIHKLQETLNSDFAIFSVSILKKLQKVEIYFEKVLDKFRVSYLPSFRI